MDRNISRMGYGTIKGKTGERHANISVTYRRTRTWTDAVLAFFRKESVLAAFCGIVLLLFLGIACGIEAGTVSLGTGLISALVLLSVGLLYLSLWSDDR